MERVVIELLDSSDFSSLKPINFVLSTKKCWLPVAIVASFLLRKVDGGEADAGVEAHGVVEDKADVEEHDVVDNKADVEEHDVVDIGYDAAIEVIEVSAISLFKASWDL